MSIIEQYNNELYHYGVKGMKWGIRKNPVEAYNKASRKLDKLNKRVERSESKMNRKIRKADRNLTKPWLFSGGNKKNSLLQNEARISVAKYKKNVRKAKDWVDSMKNSFEGTDITLTQDQIDRGKKYASILIADSLLRYN